MNNSDKSLNKSAASEMLRKIKYPEQFEPLNPIDEETIESWDQVARKNKENNIPLSKSAASEMLRKIKRLEK